MHNEINLLKTRDLILSVYYQTKERKNRVTVYYTPDSWLQGLAIRILFNKKARMFNWKAWMSHGYCVECPIIVLPILIPAHTIA